MVVFKLRGAPVDSVLVFIRDAKTVAQAIEIGRSSYHLVFTRICSLFVRIFWLASAFKVVGSWTLRTKMG